MRPAQWGSPSQTAAQVKSGECISCAECVHACPVPDTLYFRAPGKNRKKISPAAVITGTAAIFIAVLGITTFTKTFLWKAETGLPQQVERLLWGPQRIGGDNTLAEIVQIYRINPAFFAQELGITEEEVFYQTLSEAGIEPDKVKDLVNRVYKEAGLDPKNCYRRRRRAVRGGALIFINNLKPGRKCGKYSFED